MAVRIYALAKELNLDSKELVRICTKAGVLGKGSALASLTPDEVDKIKQFLKGGAPAPKKAAKPTPIPTPTPQRPAAAADAGKMRVITTQPAPPPSRSSASETTSAPAAEVEDSPPPIATEVASATAEPLPVAEEPLPVAEEPATEEKPVAAKAGTPPEAGNAAGEASGRDSKAPLRREDYVGPGGTSGKVPTMGAAKPEPKKKPGVGGQTRSRPAVKLAPIPASGTPAKTKPAANEPPAQKPDMKLPADVLGAGKMGSKPLAAHLRRHERTLDTQKTDKKDGAQKDDDNRTGRKTRGKRGGKDQEEKPTEGRPMLGGREQRQLNRRRSPRVDEDEPSTPRSSASRRLRRTSSGVNTAAPRKDRVTVELPCTVRELSEAAGVAAAQIQRILLAEGLKVRITDAIDPDLTEFVAAELGIDVEFKAAVSAEDQLISDIRELADDPDDLMDRPPVITFLGHVDHGKTSLLDRIIGIDVVSGESGGITQHIRAYTIDKDGRQISFVDTPGHEAFTEMRARGANVTDIAVLVVAADDGVMPQTEEAISHARAAEVPIVVALNKIDIPGVDENRAMQGLTANELVPSEWGGDVEVVKTSAITGDGIDDLLDTVLTVAELHEYKANPNRDALGTCLEAQQEAGRGVVAKVIVRNGTLRVGDVVTCGKAFGRVKAMYDTLDLNKRLDEVGPSTPVNLIGFDIAPDAGDDFFVIDDIAKARSVAESKADRERTAALSNAAFQHVTLENLFDRLERTEDVQTLNLILRADVRGSIEAIQKEFGKLEHPEVRIKILQSTVGGISEADVTLADASDAIIIGFNVVPDENARILADQKGVQVRRYDVIYKITEDLKAALEGMLRPEEKEVELGRALVQQVFKISRVGSVAGCRVLSGTVERHGGCRVIRDNTVVGDYPIETLRREKEDAKEVREGFECGIKLSGFNDIKEGDILEVYKIDRVDRSFDD